MDDHDEEPPRNAQDARGRSGSKRARVGLMVVGAAVLLGVDAVAFGLVRDWINGTRDLYPLLAFGLVALLVVAHIALALRASSRND